MYVGLRGERISSDFADDSETAQALSEVLVHSKTNRENCNIISTTPAIHICNYTARGDDFSILTRTFELTTMLVAGNNQASLDFIRCNFTETTPQDAARYHE